MRKLSYIFLIIGILNFVACDDKTLLDIQQQGVLSVKETYEKSNDEGVNALIAAVYYKTMGSYLAESFGGEFSSSYSGIRAALNNRDGDFADYNDYLSTSETNSYAKMWSYYYTVSYWCNMIIENVPNNTVASEKVKDQAIAEARAIRAIMVMQLIQLYGNPPLPDHILDGYEGNTPASTSWAFVNKEFSEVAGMLPSKSNVNGQNSIGGRLTKEAVYAYLGKALLWQKNYTEAAKVLYQNVINTGLYQLIPKFSSLNSKAADFSSENIWEIEVTEVAGYETVQTGMFDVTQYNWGTIGMYIPDGYYTANGWGVNTGFSSSFGTFMETHEAVGIDKSPRYRATLASYEEILDSKNFTYASGKKGVKPVGISSNEGYFRVKFIPRAEDIMGAANDWIYNISSRNEKYMRYAEVLLNYAEAVAMGGANGSNLSGLQALNLVRNRAGLTDAPQLVMDNSVYGIKAERRAEFAYEGQHFIDLVRWGDASSTLAECGKYSPTFYGYQDKNNSTIQDKSQWRIVKVNSLGEGFKSNKNELFPIPSIEINKNPNLKQNPGW